MTIRWILSILIFLPFFSCEKNARPKNGKPTVLVSVPPYVYFVQKIAQDAVEIETLVPAGVNPHVYEATPKEVQRHQNAVLWIYLGESFDKKILKFFQDVKKPIQIINMTEGTDLLSICEEDDIVTEHVHCHHSHDEGKDLHVWLSPTLAKHQAEKITDALIRLLPEKQMSFQANLQSFLNELNDLDKQITHLLEPMKGKAILVSHPAFGYFCRDYHLVQLSIEIEGKEPLPQHVTEILAKAKCYSIQTVITEPQYSNKGAELLAQSLGLPTHMVDPYAENFSENLLFIARVIAK
jgi:zinc transport system substrate-binding protein